MNNTPPITEKIFAFALLLPAIIFSSARAADTAQPMPVWHPNQFIVSFWCGPPDKFVTRERYQQVADAGFTTIMPTCHPTSTAMNKIILRTAYETHLKAFVQDDRMPMSLADPKAKENIDAIISDYSSLPGLGGYFLADEPSDGAFKGLGDVIDYFRQKDPAHPVFINLLPTYAPGGMVGTDYNRYVTDLITVAHAWCISYDHYHFTVGGDGPYFFDNLQAVAHIAKQYDMAFFNIVLATQHGPYRRLTEPEKRYEAMQTLAFGARGLLWFTYWQPDASGMWKDAIINLDGTPTWQYPQIKRINHDLAAFGDALLHAEWIHTWTGNPPPLTVTFEPLAHCTVGFFKQQSTRMLFIANQDYKNPIATDLHIQSGGSPIERFDLQTKTFVPDDATHLQLGPAEAALYRWTFRN